MATLPPAALAAILRDTHATGFTMASDEGAGRLLRTLATSRPAGTLLELGTGTGCGAAWLLDGMDAGSTLWTIEQDETVAAIARRHLGDDARVRFLVEDGDAFLQREHEVRFDLIFADTWPGKFRHLDRALALLAPGGLYVVDDLLPQPNWPPGHEHAVARLVDDLESRPDLTVVRLDWSTGLLLAARRQ